MNNSLRSLVVASLVFAIGGAWADEPPIRAGEKLTLERAVALALAYHPARLAAQSRLGAARERIGEARSALLPQVYGAAQYLRATDNGIGDTTYLGAPGIPRVPSQGRHVNQLTETFNNYLSGISAYQYLFDFGRTRGLIAQRDAEADAERARLHLVDLDLIYAVAKAYFDLVAADKIVGVYETAVVQRQQHLDAAQVKARAGLRAEIDVYTAQSELARAKLHLVSARNDAATARALLDNAMGLGERTLEYTQDDTLGYAAIGQPLAHYLAEAFVGRPDLTMLEDEARAAGAEIVQARGQGLPSIGAVAGYDVRGQDATPGNNFRAGVVITWPIFTGFLTQHEAEEARLRQDAIAHGIQELRQEIVLQVKSAFLDWTASLERIHHAERTVAASRVEFDLAQKRYDMGLGSIIELTDAQRRLTEDSAEYVNALAGFSIAKAALARSIGGTVGDTG
jgi:outer membrane protein